jgi:hypothetical protein
MTVQIGQLFRKRTVRNLRGQIIELLDETDGGVIISKGRVVNQEKVDEMARKEEDRRKAATAFTQQATTPPEVIEQRATTPTKMQELEKKVAGMEDNLTKILELLQKK